MTKAAGASARFRQRKISVRQTLQVLWQSDIPDLEDEQQRDLHQVETGVEKGEEEEHHLQAAINASLAASAGAKVEQVYIPTPDASKIWSDYSKYYTKSFSQPTSYIRFSATVEDTSGCPYCMDEKDEEFLTKMNSGKVGNVRCSEDEFEMICYRFETVSAERQPFLSMDPTQILDFDEMSEFVIDKITEAETDPSSPEFLLASSAVVPSLYTTTLKRAAANKTQKKPLNSFKQFGSLVYPHWRDRKIERGGKSIFPILKFEDSDKDDSDPYVCFRRRELRQVRKTRRADIQSSEKLRKLEQDMENAKKLMDMVVKREQMRKEALQLEWDIFEQRCKVKSVKRSLGIKGDDEDLVAHKKKKVSGTAEEVAKAKAAAASAANIGEHKSGSLSNPNTTASPTSMSISFGQSGAANHSPSSLQSVPANVRLPASKIPDMDLLTIEQVLAEKEKAIKNAVNDKLLARATMDTPWKNYTDNPFIPYCDYFDPSPSHASIEIVDPKRLAYSSIATSYPPYSSCVEPLKLPIIKSLGASYSKRLEPPPFVVRSSFSEDGELKADSVMSERDEKFPSGLPVPRHTAVSLRRRIGRGGRMLVDRRGLIRYNNSYSDMKEFDHSPASTVGIQESQSSQLSGTSKQQISVKLERLEDRYRFDSEMHTDDMGFPSSDPGRLNGISDDTQSIRFGSMLLSKSYESYREAYQQRQQQLLSLQQKMLQQQQLQNQLNQQLQHQQLQAAQQIQQGQQPHQQRPQNHINTVQSQAQSNPQLLPPSQQQQSKTIRTPSDVIRAQGIKVNPGGAVTTSGSGGVSGASNPSGSSNQSPMARQQQVASLLTAQRLAQQQQLQQRPIVDNGQTKISNGYSPINRNGKPAIPTVKSTTSVGSNNTTSTSASARNSTPEQQGNPSQRKPSTPAQPHGSRPPTKVEG